MALKMRVSQRQALGSQTFVCPHGAWHEQRFMSTWAGAQRTQPTHLAGSVVRKAVSSKARAVSRQAQVNGSCIRTCIWATSLRLTGSPYRRSFGLRLCRPPLRPRSRTGWPHPLLRALGRTTRLATSARYARAGPFDASGLVDVTVPPSRCRCRRCWVLFWVVVPAPVCIL